MKLVHLNPASLFAAPGGMYSHAVRAGEQLYISGQIARDLDGKLVGDGDVVAQYRHVWASLGTVLAAAGLGYEHLVKTTTYVVGEANVPAIRALRKELAPPKPPASTMLVLPALAIPGALVEVDAIAVFPAARRARPKSRPRARTAPAKRRGGSRRG
ncbi:MAG TPA: RidA family protein [Burkholderiales bacterium]|nr:RidA family protein [Burkholderiales bacterium]